MMKLIAFTLALALTVQGIPVDNGVEGDPEIECGPTSITVNFNTLNEFEGQVYVKGLYAEDACISRDGGRQVAGIELPFDTCNTRRQRSLNPKGVFVTTTVIISFHPLFVTKVDRAYRVQCFYMEADKTVSTDLEVSMLTTDFKTQFVPMPICRYEIVEPGTDNIIQFALVGDPVEHRWICDTETVDTFCMSVHSCFVDDTNGDRVDLLNEDGCANDRYLLNNPEYPTDLTAAVEAHVFKYADRPQLYFECQISIQVKEPNDECPRPSCPEPAGRGAGNANPRVGPQPPPPRHLFPVGPGAYSDTNPVFGQPQLGSGGEFFPPPAAPLSRVSDPASRRRGGGIGNIDFRGKRSVENSKYAGTVDVNVAIDALDASTNTFGRPDAAHRAPLPRHRAIVLNSNSTDYCLPHSLVVTTGTIVLLMILSFIAAISFLASRRKQI